MWRYRLDRHYLHASDHLAGVTYRNEWIDIRHGAIMIERGYAWDGCSPAWRLPGGVWLGAPDGPRGVDGRPLAYHASLVHDALCQFKAEVPISKTATVALFAELLQLAGFPSWRVWLYATAVSKLGPQRFGADAPNTGTQ